MKKLYSVIDWFDWGADTCLIRAKDKKEAKMIAKRETKHTIELENIEEVEKKEFIILSSIHE